MKLGISGITGRAGSALYNRALSEGITVPFRWSRRQRLIDGIPDVVVDLSSPELCAEVANYCADNRISLIVATSGLSPDQRAHLAKAARATMVVMAANLSIGSYFQRLLCQKLLEISASLPSAQFSVLDRHSTVKKDAPSGTAVALRAICESNGRESRVESVRYGERVATHDVTCTLSLSETLQIRHNVTDLDAAAVGALTAARWLYERQLTPSLLTIDEVFASVAGVGAAQKEL